MSVAGSHGRIMQSRKIFQMASLDHFLLSLAALSLKGSLLRIWGKEAKFCQSLLELLVGYALLPDSSS